MLKLAREIQEEQDWLKRESEQRTEARKKQQAIDARDSRYPRGTASEPASAPPLPPWPPVIPENASATVCERAELQEEEDAVTRRRARIAELDREIEAERLAPRLEAIREMFAQRADAVALAEGRSQPKGVEGKLRQFDIAAQLEDVLVALAITHDCSALLEAMPMLVVEALNENVARLRGQLFRDNIALGQRRYALQGRRNPTERAPVVARPWRELLAVARGEN
jgi:hypothetical protein